MARRVAFVTGEYPPSVGGVGDYTARLAGKLAGLGTAVEVVTGRSPGGAGGAVAARRAVADWGVRGWRGLGRTLRAARPEVVHLQYQAGAFGGRAAVHLLPRLTRRAVRPAPATVVTFHDLLVPYLFPKAGLLRARALKRLARDCDAVIATNGDDWRQLRDDERIARKLHLIPIGSNIPPLAAAGRAAAVAAVRAALGVDTDEPLVAYFGLVAGSKGVETLLDALARLPEPRTRLALIGGEASGSDRVSFGAAGDLRAAVAARGLADRVTITGALPAEEVAAYLAAADVVALPYRDGASWRRGSLLAALVAGAAVVTTTPGAGYDADRQLPALTDGVAALLVPPDDADALAAALGRALGDAALRSRLSAGALALAREFDWATIARRHEAVYDEVSRQSSGGRGRVVRELGR